MEQSIARPETPDRIVRLIAFAQRQPARALAWLLGLHLVVWTLIPILTYRNLQLDLAEGLALGPEWQLGYWKHPPLPWLIEALAYRIAGDVRIVYLLGPLACVIALYALWRLALQVTTAQNALIAVLALEGLHFFNFTAVKFNHDVLQLPFWALTGWFVYRAITGHRPADWLLSGLWLAGAFWTKYSVLVLAVPIGCVLLFDPFARPAWRTSGPYLMAAAFLLVIAPQLWWLIDSDFLPLHYADVRAETAAVWYQWIVFPLRWIASQIFFLLPTLGLLALALAGTRRNESVAATAPADFARRYVAVLGLGPFILVTLGAALTGRLVVAIWGYPFWTFTPLALLVWRAPAIGVAQLRAFTRACLFVLVGMPAAYVAVETLEPLLRDRPKATQFPGQILAATITRQWRDATGTPLAYVGGAELGASGAGEFAADTVAVYSPDRPHVLAHGDLALSPWIDRADLDRRGIVLLWEGTDALPENLKAAFPRAALQPPLVLPRQTLAGRKPATVSYAFVRPRP
jgi:4-amino-4-deoxy-L-arabinose transferase-like glycosyltransferase